MNEYATLTPYIIPASMPGKVINLGDGFILKAIERRLGNFPSERVFSSRVAPSDAQIEVLKTAKGVILAGANQLSDKFAVWPGLSADELRKTGLRAIPFGIGIDGDPKKNVTFTDATLDTLRVIHERIEFSSWRCPRTIAALEGALPELSGRFLMTGCPVVYDRPLLEEAKFNDRTGTVAVTVTERGEFWQREAQTLRFAAKQFKNSKRYLVLHQAFEQPRAFETTFGHLPGAGLFLSRRARLRALARKLGFEIIAPKTAADCIRFYDGVDVHLGSRLHAHLLFLSRNKRSFLTYVDDRMLGFSDFLKFPLSDPANFDRDMNFDFEQVRTAARVNFVTMEKFVESIGRG